jgi:RNA polymerase sigma-70 factor (ECF subfamily)
MPATDAAQLAKQAQAGDQAALAMLLRQQQDRLFHLALRLVSDRDDAAEVTQEALLRIVDQFDTFRGQSQVTTWMRRILINQAFSLLRKRQTRQRHHAPVGQAVENGAASRADVENAADGREPSPAARVEQEETAAQLQAAIDQLEETFRTVLVLRDIDEMSYAEIGHVLELAPGTVKSRLFRARLQLRQHLEQMGFTGSP